MTSSETPTDKSSDAARERWMRWAVLASATVAGWGFIAFAHRWHVTAASVFLSIGWLAVVLGAHNLWRTGVATSDAVEEEAEWWRPVGAHDELEREKRALLKAIKEIDFDRQTGKMSDADAQALTRVYRARAIEVIKAIDELAAGGAATTRERIDREIKARLAIANAEAAAAKKQEKQQDKGKGKPGGKPSAKGRLASAMAKAAEPAQPVPVAVAVAPPPESEAKADAVGTEPAAAAVPEASPAPAADAAGDSKEAS
jgi:hypothetical protein